MIDYEKLGRLYGEELESYLNGLVKYWEDKVQETKELIAKHKLTKPEPKYKVGQKWWALGNKGMPFEVEIVGIMGGDVDLLYPDGSCSYGGVKDLFPTRQALIEHQLQYWRNQLEDELGQHVSNYCEPLRDKPVTEKSCDNVVTQCKHDVDYSRIEGHLYYKCNQCGGFYG